MLTRIYIDKFRSFVNFEYRPQAKQLLLGPNGSGKSSLMQSIRYVSAAAALYAGSRTNAIVPTYCIDSLRTGIRELQRLRL